MSHTFQGPHAHAEELDTIDFRSESIRTVLLFALLLAALAITFLLYLGTGPVAISAQRVIGSLFSPLPWPTDWSATAGETAVIHSIRLPRALMAATVGAGLAVSGAAMQGLFRNPLADPGLLGVSGGAALAAVSWIVFGGVIAEAIPLLNHRYALPLVAFIGSALASLGVFLIADRRGSSVAMLLLTGIAINAITGAMTGLMVYAADDEQLRSFTFWTMGSLANGTWSNLSFSAPIILCTALISPFFANGLNALLLGESEARHLGHSPERLKVQVILLVSLSVGAAVAFCGMIGFVGLVVPHLIRLVIGPDHRILLPASALLGASLLLLADMLGCNGAGKSSLLKIMAGDLKATSGSVSLEGKVLDQYSASALAKRRAVLTQKSTLSFAFKVHQVVAMGAANCGLRRADKERLIILLLRLTGTQHLVQRDYTSLSGGEQQRVHFARTLAQLWHSTTVQSPILLLDEPVAALDLAWQQRVLEIAQWLVKSRQWSVLAVLHDMNQAAAYADQVYLLEDGHRLKSGTPRETLSSANLKQAFGVLAHVHDHPLVPERPQVIPIKADLPAIEGFF